MMFAFVSLIVSLANSVVRDFAVPEKEIFKCDRTLRRTDTAQHCGKDLIAVL
jgi:hypothetical protein